MIAEDGFEQINEAKAEMGHIYNQPDPRAYFRELKGLGYSIPDEAKPVFKRLIGHLRRSRNEDTVHVLDLGCSYGVNAALLKHDLAMPDLYKHWGQDHSKDASPQEVAEIDQRYFANLDEPEDIEVIGLDQAENAVFFAEEIGLLDEALAVNLETSPLTKPNEEELAAVDLVTSTGCVGYVTEKSFKRLLPAVAPGRPPWLANFVLRMFPFDTIEQTLSEHGYVTEKLENHTFIQRRFASAEEREQVLDHLSDQGVDPTGKETEGYLLAEFYLSRPTSEGKGATVDRLVFG
jgi:hypothetical protein